MPVPQDNIDVHNQFFLTTPIIFWSFQSFVTHCLNSKTYISEDDSSSIKNGFMCGIHKALQRSPPFDKLNISPLEEIFLQKLLLTQELKKQNKRQRHITAAPTGSITQYGDTYNSHVALPGHSHVVNMMKSTSTVTSVNAEEAYHSSGSSSYTPPDSPCPPCKSTKRESQRPTKRSRTNMAPDVACSSDSRTKVQEVPTVAVIDDEVIDGPAAILDTLFDEEGESVIPSIDDDSDIKIQSGLSLVQAVNDFLQSDSAQKIDKTTQSANIARTANTRTHSNVLLRIMFQQLKKHVIFPHDRQSQTQLVNHFATAADLQKLKDMGPTLAQLTDLERKLFSNLQQIATVEGYRTTNTNPPIGYTPELLKAWFFMLQAVTFSFVSLPKLLSTMSSRHEGWWESTIWSPLLTSALSTSSMFEFDQRDITSLVDENHSDIHTITPRPPRSTATAVTHAASPETTAPTAIKTIKYDAIVRRSARGKARMVDSFDLAFMEVKSEACKTSPYVDRVKLLSALRRSLLIIRSRLMQKLSDTKEVDEAMAKVVTVGILCNGEVATFMLANNLHGQVVLVTENSVAVGEQGWRVAEMAWRVRLTLEQTCGVLMRTLEEADIGW